MRLNRLKGKFKKSTHVMLVLAVLLMALSSCTADSPVLPAFRMAPEVITLDTLLAEYNSDPAAASEKYGGRTYLFPGVAIDYVLSPTLTPLEYQLGGKPHFSTGQVTFLARYLYDLDTLAPGFVIDVQGEVQGWVQSEFVISSCIFSIAKGGDIPPPGAY